MQHKEDMIMVSLCNMHQCSSVLFRKHFTR